MFYIHRNNSSSCWQTQLVFIGSASATLSCDKIAGKPTD